MGLKYFIALFLVLSAFKCFAAPVRVGIIDTPIDYSHPSIAPFIGRTLSPLQIENTKRLRGYLKTIPEAAFAELQATEDIVFSDRVRGELLRKYPALIEAVHGTSTSSVLLDSFLPQDISFFNTLSDADFTTENWKNWIKENQIEIIVMPFDVPPNLEDAKRSQREWQEMIQEFPNTLFIVSAGNTRNWVDQFPSIAKLTGENIIKVAATDYDGNPAYFTTFSTLHVDLGAPGILVPVALPDGRYSKSSGTSFSAPLVGAAATRVKLKNRNASPAQIKTKILKEESVEKHHLTYVVGGGRFLLPPQNRMASHFGSADYEPNLCRLAMKTLTSSEAHSFTPDFRARKFMTMQSR